MKYFNIYKSKIFNNSFGNNTFNNPSSSLYGKPSNNSSLPPLNKLTILSMLCAVYIVLGFISIPLGAIKLTIEGLPIFIAGFLYGPKEGVIVGFVGPFIYQILNYGFTPTTILWIFPHTITGLFAGCFKYGNYALEVLTEKKENVEKYIRDHYQIEICIFICLVNTLSTLINSVALYTDSNIFGYYNEVLITGTLFFKIVIGIIKGIVYGIVIPKILVELNKVIKNN